LVCSSPRGGSKSKRCVCGYLVPWATFWRPRQDTSSTVTMSDANALEAEVSGSSENSQIAERAGSTLGSSRVALVDGVDWVNLQRGVIENGKLCGKTGDDLLVWVEEEMAKLREQHLKKKDREERAAKRQTDLAARDVETRIELQARQQAAQSSKTTKLEIPKFAGQDVTEYLDLFEAVLTQNKEPRSTWALFLRSALAGTSVASAVNMEYFTDYDEVKKEILLTFGSTASQVWRALLGNKQGQETFRQYSMRVGRTATRWIKLATGKEDLSGLAADDVVVALAKQLVLEASDADLSAYILRSEPSSKGFDTFCELGTTYQASFTSSSHPEPEFAFCTAQALYISVEQAERKLFALPAHERLQFMRFNRLCYNCLKPGHPAATCPVESSCGQCTRKHHVLLHTCFETLNQSRGIKAYSCHITNPVHLMTAVAETKGETLRAQVRVFVDLGSQSSFVTPSLVQAIRPKKVAEEKVSVKPFGSPSAVSTLRRYELQLKGADGQTLSMEALETDRCDIQIPVTSGDSVVKWRAHGIELADQCHPDVPDEIHVLVGADYANSILDEKKEVDGQVVWKTKLGWMLSGPAPGPKPKEKKINAASITADRRQAESFTIDTELPVMEKWWIKNYNKNPIGPTTSCRGSTAI